MTWWGWVFIAEGVLFLLVIGVLALGLLRRVRELRAQLGRLQAVVPASPVPARLTELQAARSQRQLADRGDRAGA